MANITYIRIEDKVYGLHDENALTSNSNLDASKVVGTLPANTYVDTTYENKAAVEDGTDVSLVTTGDKYRWNQGGSSGLQNLVDSSATGGVRGIGTAVEDSSYTMGLYAFAEGLGTKASGHESHAEGYYSIASGIGSHAEGQSTAGGEGAHSEGNSTAGGNYSHSQNYNTIASKLAQTALGAYNIEDTSTATTHSSEITSYGQYALIVGNGSATNQRSNALTVDWAGEIEIALNTTAASGTDKEIYDALVSLGWDSDVIV